MTSSSDHGSTGTGEARSEAGSRRGVALLRSASTRGRLRRTGLLLAFVVVVAWALAAVATGDTSSSVQVERDPAGGQPFDGEHRRALEERLDRERERRDSPEAQAKRRRSQEAYVNLDRHEARRLAQRTFPGALQAPVFTADAAAVGGEVKRWLGAYRAVVQHPDGQRGVVQSTAPLLGEGTDGHAEPVDHGLTERGGSYVPVNPVTSTRIGKSAANGAWFGETAFGVRLADAADSEGVLEHDRVFFAEVTRDTDLVAYAVPGGVEMALQLRSVHAPERFRFHVELPEGAHVGRVELQGEHRGDRPQTLEVVKGHHRLGLIYAPQTFDAEGASVPSRFEVSGSEVELVVEHRGRDLAWPLLADPEVIATGGWNIQQWAGWEGGWWKSSGRPYNFRHALNDPAWAPGMYVGLDPYQTYDQWDQAWFRYRAPANAYVYRAEFGNISHGIGPDFNPGGMSNAYHGLLDSNGNWQGNVDHNDQYGGYANANPSNYSGGYAGLIHTFCFNNGPRCYTPSPADQNEARFGIYANQNVYMGNRRTDAARAGRTSGWETGTRPTSPVASRRRAAGTTTEARPARSVRSPRSTTGSGCTGWSWSGRRTGPRRRGRVAAAAPTPPPVRAALRGRPRRASATA